MMILLMPSTGDHDDTDDDDGGLRDELTPSDKPAYPPYRCLLLPVQGTIKIISMGKLLPDF